MGTGFHPGQHAAYIGSWLKALREDPSEVFKAGRDAARIVEYTLEVEKRPEVEILRERERACDAARARKGEKPHERRYLDVPYKERKEAKAAGAKWDRDAKRWYAPEDLEDASGLDRWKPKDRGPDAGEAPASAGHDALVHRLGVGDLVRLDVDMGKNVAGAVGVVVGKDSRGPAEQHGVTVLFSNGEHFGFFPKDASACLSWEGESASTFAREYACRNVYELGRDFREGRFDGAFERRVSVERPGGGASFAPRPGTIEAAGRDYLDVPYEERREAKEAGAKWDRSAKRWYVPEDLEDRSGLERWEPDRSAAAVGATRAEYEGKPDSRDKRVPGRAYLDVSYEEREAAKAAGAKWDWKAKSWYAPEDLADSAELARWKSRERDPVAEFGEVLADTGLVLDGPPQLDGALHRVPVEGAAPGKRDGAYVGHADAPMSGWYQNHRSGDEGTWRASGTRGHDLDTAQMEAQRREREATREREQAERAAALEREMASMGQLDTGHQYLVSKGIDSASVRADVKGDKGDIVIPIRDVEGRIQSVQRIGPDGQKRNARGARMAGGCALVGEDTGRGPVYVASGFSTAAAIHQATGAPVWAAMSDANMRTIAEGLAERNGNRPMVICGDDDHLAKDGKGRPRNSGEIAARAAAKAAGAAVVMPKFGAKRGAKDTDFADLLKAEGPAAVSRQVRAGACKAVELRRQRAREADGPARDVEHSPTMSR